MWMGRWTSNAASSLHSAPHKIGTCRGRLSCWSDWVMIHYSPQVCRKRLWVKRLDGSLAQHSKLYPLRRPHSQDDGHRSRRSHGLWLCYSYSCRFCSA
jgi:hypothetical protein